MREEVGGIALSASLAWILRLRAKRLPQWLALDKMVKAGGGGGIRPDTVQIAYCTDVEGNWPYFCSWVKLSQGVSFADGTDGLAATECAELRLKDGWQFVFGGDAGDKGSGTLCFVRTMNLFKRRYPDRIHILLGNRDLNKMRLTSEIHSGELDLIDTLSGPPWVPDAKSVSPKMYLTAQIANKKSIPKEDVTESMLKAENTLANRLKWMLTETMGSDGDFERRHEELTRCRKGSHEITDEEVVESFVSSVQPGGCILELLELGVLGVVLGDTLFVHGGLIGQYSLHGKSETSCFGFVPNEGTYGDVHLWVQKLNEWKQRELREWQAQPIWTSAPQFFLEQYGLPGALSMLLPSTLASGVDGEYPSKPKGEARKRGGEELMSYVVPGCKPSVVLGRHLTPKGMPEQLPCEIQRKLQQGAVYRVVVGHTPHGHSPTVIAPTPADSDEGVVVVMGDTSFSDMRFQDNRGVAVSHIGISVAIPSPSASLPPVPCKRSSLTVNGVLPNRQVIFYEVKRGNPSNGFIGTSVDKGDELVGIKVTEGFLSKIKDGQQLADPGLPRFVKVTCSPCSTLHPPPCTQLLAVSSVCL
jgi:hypothetical protein